MKVIFMGTPEFATYALNDLYKSDHEIVAVYTQPPKIQNRGCKLELSKIHSLADSLSLNIKTPKSLRNTEAQLEFSDLNADIAIVAAYGMILPEAILKAPKYGCINIHPSMLPRWRGAAPIQRTMLAGDSETAVCIMKMDAGLDTGDIIKYEKILLSEKENFLELHDKLAKIGSKLLIEVLSDIENMTFHKQSEQGITYADKINKDETRINWNGDVKFIDRLIRTLNPPGVYFEYKGERIKILQAHFDVTNHDYKNGEVIDSKLTIAVKNGFIKPIIVQRAGKKPMKIEDMLRGYDIAKGIILSI